MIDTGARRALAVMAVALIALAGCSGDDDSTCEDLQTLASDVRGLQDVDVVQTGLDGLQEQTDKIDAAWQTSKESSGSQFDTELVALKTSIDALGSTLSGATDSGDSIKDVVDQVGDDITQIGATWDDLDKAVDAELGDCDLSAEDG